GRHHLFRGGRPDREPDRARAACAQGAGFYLAVQDLEGAPRAQPGQRRARGGRGARRGAGGRVSESHVSEYHDSMVAFLEWIWGRDYMAPGGEGNVDRMVAGIELAGRRVLDIGCGIGGPAFVLARKYGAEVTGIDLEPQLVARANRRAEELGLSERAEFRTVTL